jgi:hypothetical protein
MNDAELQQTITELLGTGLDGSNYLDALTAVREFNTQCTKTFQRALRGRLRELVHAMGVAPPEADVSAYIWPPRLYDDRVGDSAWVAAQISVDPGRVPVVIYSGLTCDRGGGWLLSVTMDMGRAGVRDRAKTACAKHADAHAVKVDVWHGNEVDVWTDLRRDKNERVAQLEAGLDPCFNCWIDAWKELGTAQNLYP